MKSNRIIALSLVLIVGVIAFLGFYVKGISEKNPVVYVDNVKLFNGFNMAKDLSASHTKKMNKQRKRVDSIYQEFQKYAQAKDEKQVEQTRHVLQNEDKLLTDMQEYFKNEVSQQVWQRINTSLKKYGEKQGYELVLGANGNGSVMYANQATVDITDSFLAYANAEYEGE